MSSSAAGQQSRSIDKTQIKLIHIAQSQIGLSDDEYRTMLADRYWVSSCKDLSYNEASDLIKHLQSLGFKIVTKRHERKKLPSNVIALVSERQSRLIEHLKSDVIWYVQDGFIRWLKKFLKKDKITTSKDANRVIEALKSMANRSRDAERRRIER